MAADTDIVNRALSLPPDARGELARKLILSLDDEPFDQDADDLWAVEIEARLRQVDRGEVTPLDWRESVERARQALRRKNAS